MLGLVGIENILNDTTVVRKIIDMTVFSTKIYPATHLTLFCILTQVISLKLKAIHQLIEDKLNKRKVSSLTSVIESQRSQLIFLRRHHRLICKAVRKINRHFGVYLTLEIGYIFVVSINSSLYILMSGMNVDGLLGVLSLSIWLDGFVHLFLLTSFSEDIINQVHYTCI